MERKATPWVISDNPIIKSWTWKTEHFEAKIFSMGQGNGIAWKVIDISGTDHEVLEAGEADCFVNAEEQVLEIVGKSYPIRFGYMAYAGDLATTFTLKNGDRANFAPYIGSNVIIEVFNKQQPERTKIITGTLDVSHFNIEIRTDRDTKLAIPPAFIISVRKEFDTQTLQAEVKKVGSKRVFNEEWRKGCTGKPGYSLGTVVHNPTDMFCPLHDG